MVDVVNPMVGSNAHCIGLQFYTKISETETLKEQGGRVRVQDTQVQVQQTNNSDSDKNTSLRAQLLSPTTYKGDAKFACFSLNLSWFLTSYPMASQLSRNFICQYFFSSCANII